MSVTPDSVQQLLNSEDFGDRLKGIIQLRQLDSSLAFKMVKPLVKDENTRVRYAAVSFLDSVGHHNISECLELLKDRLFQDSEIDVKSAAADAIGGLKIKEGYQYLEEAYHQTQEWLLQFSIIATLGELGDPRGFELLKDALNSDNNLLQTTAISSFGELGDPRAIPLLIPFAQNPDWQIRFRVAQALGILQGDEAISVLTKLAEDEVEQVATIAKNYLCN